MAELDIDPLASSVRVRTRARGMLAAFAHDLELRSIEVRGHAVADRETWSAELAVPVASLRVAGTLHGDRLDASALSPGDRSEIERKVREEVLSVVEVTVRAQGTSRARAELTATVQRSAPASATLRAEAGDGGVLVVTGRTELSLKALGVREVKGPLGAFKLADSVEVLFELTLRPAATEAGAG